MMDILTKVRNKESFDISHLYKPFILKNIEDTLSDKEINNLFVSSENEICLIKILPMLSYKQVSNFLENFTYKNFFEKTYNSCSISLEDKECSKLSCGHYVGVDELNKWMLENKKNTCPVCRQKILEDDLFIYNNLNSKILRHLIIFNNYKAFKICFNKFPDNINIQNIINECLVNYNLDIMYFIVKKYNPEYLYNDIVSNSPILDYIYKIFPEKINLYKFNYIVNKFRFNNYYTMRNILIDLLKDSSIFSEAAYIIIRNHKSIFPNMKIYNIVNSIYENIDIKFYNKIINLVKKSRKSNLNWLSNLIHNITDNYLETKLKNNNNLSKIWYTFIHMKHIYNKEDFIKMDQYTRASSCDSNLLQKIVVLPIGNKILDELDEYINNNMILLKDLSSYNSILDCIKYGNYHSLMKLYSKCKPENKDLTINTFEDHIYTVITLAFGNKDLRVFKFIINKYKISNDQDSLKNIIDNIKSINWIPYSKLIKRIKIFNSIYPNHNLIRLYHNKNSGLPKKVLIEQIVNYDYDIYDIDLCYFSNTSMKELFNNKYLLSNIIKNIGHNTTNLYHLYYDLFANFCWKDERFEMINDKIDYKKIDIRKLLTISINNISFRSEFTCKCCKQTEVKCIGEYILLLKNNNISFSDLFQVNHNYHNYPSIPILSIIFSRYYGNLNKFTFIDAFAIYTPMIRELRKNSSIVSSCYGFTRFFQWVKVYQLFRRVIYRRYFNDKRRHKHNFSFVINQLEYNPENKFKNIGRKFKETMLEITNSFERKPNPEHITPFNILDSLKSNYLLITEKADGITRHMEDLEGKELYPHFPENLISNKFDMEFLETENMLFIFDNYSIDNDDYANINYYLRQYHPYVPNQNAIMSINDYERYCSLEKVAYENYKKANPNKLHWWPKAIFTIINTELLEKLDEIVIKTNRIFPTDGWILRNMIDHKDIKIKPNYHLTIDLKNINNRWYSKDGIEYKVKGRDKDNGVWRCYWSPNDYLWEPRDYRKDKLSANLSSLEKCLRLQHIYPYKFKDITIINQFTPYYQINTYGQKYHKDYNKLNFIDILGLIKRGDNVLDLGCGYNSNRLSKNLSFNKWLGIDNDFEAIKFLRENSDNKMQWIWGDFTKSISNNFDQNGNFYKNINNKMNIQKFDIIIVKNAIHFAGVSNKKWSTFIHNLECISDRHTKIIISYLDSISLEELFKENLRLEYNGNTIEKTCPKPNSMSNYWIKIFYKNRHIVPITEPVLDEDKILDALPNWKKYQKFYSKINKNPKNIWDKYKNCFKYLVLQKN